MKIALDATYSLDRNLSGVGVYSRDILYGLAKAHPEAGRVEAGFWGVYSSGAIHPGKHPSHVDAYYLGLDRNPAVFNQGIAHETRHTLGARIWNVKSAWNYDWEAMFQFGSFGAGNIHAWRVASDTSYGFASVRWQPRFGFGADVSSGDTARVAVEVIACPAITATGKSVLKLAFPLDVGPLPQVPTVENQQVESQIHNTLGVLPTQLTAQRLKVRNTVRAHDHCFTVEDRLTRPKLARCFCDRGKPIGPVITAAGIDGDVLVIDVGLGPVTVGFDFVEPLISGRGLFPKGRVAKFDESRRC